MKIKYLRRCDGLEALLSSCVPNLSFYSAAGLQGDAFRGELYTNGRILILRQFIFDVSTEQMGLAHTSVSNQNH